MLSAIMRLVVHATAVELRFHPKYPHPECGPWDHYAGFGDPCSESDSE